MDETKDHHIEQNKPRSKGQISNVFGSFVDLRPKMMMMGHDCKRGTVRVEESLGGENGEY
jgi:hypothetical protein